MDEDDDEDEDEGVGVGRRELRSGILWRSVGVGRGGV